MNRYIDEPNALATTSQPDNKAGPKDVRKSFIISDEIQEKVRPKYKTINANLFFCTINHKEQNIHARENVILGINASFLYKSLMPVIIAEAKINDHIENATFFG